jgi:hypothetical protein
MWCTGSVKCLGKMIKCEGKRPLARPRRRWKDNNEINMKGIIFYIFVIICVRKCFYYKEVKFLDNKLVF